MVHKSVDSKIIPGKFLCNNGAIFADDKINLSAEIALLDFPAKAMTRRYKNFMSAAKLFTVNNYRPHISPPSALSQGGGKSLLQKQQDPQSG